jgi:hypothetical protein
LGFSAGGAAGPGRRQGRRVMDRCNYMENNESNVLGCLSDHVVGTIPSGRSTVVRSCIVAGQFVPV